MNVQNRYLTILFLVLALTLMISACSSKLDEYITALDDNGDVESYNSSNESDKLMQSFSNQASESDPVVSSPFENELNGLRLVLAPYLEATDPRYIGNDNTDYIENYLLNSDNNDEQMKISDWSKVIRILFNFETPDKQWIKMYIDDFSKEGYIERQHAVSGLMKLLSMRYPISLGGAYEDVKRSEIISDLDIIDDRYQMLIRQAYCLGLADLEVDTSRLFRPEDLLYRSEAVSMLYHVLLNYGLPASEPVETSSVEPDEEETTDSSLQDQFTEAYSNEDIQLEYKEYFDSLNENSTKGKKRIEMLTKAEMIIGPGLYSESSSDPIGLDQWEMILNEVFELSTDEIKPYLSYETGGILTYDVAAISIFKLSFLFGSYDIRDATEMELEDARIAIPQFDTARDTSKFAQMYSSGLIDGLYQMPGFTPQRPVNISEALLLVKRMIENIK